MTWPAVIDSVENNQTASWFNGTRSILLAVYRQPDANTVAVVDSIKEVLPNLEAQVPPSVNVTVLIDRSQSIRDVGHDVQFTLGLAIGLVILVIFLFLRSLTATIIPAIALPISLIGTFGGMYLFGYSIDNLSLLALTLSVGFIVDDAIVMLENIVRHVEEGEQPFEAALRGSREIALHHRLDDRLAGGGVHPGAVHGRRRRAAVQGIRRHHLDDDPDLRPRLADADADAGEPDAAAPGPNIQSSVRRSIAGRRPVSMLCLPAMTARCGWRCRVRAFMLLVTFATLVASVYYYIAIPKGFFPNEDTGTMIATTEAGQDVSFDAMVKIQSELAKIVQADPAVAVVNSTVGAGGPNSSVNSGRMFIGLKPLAERKVSADRGHSAAAPQARRHPFGEHLPADRSRTSGWAAGCPRASINMCCKAPTSRPCRNSCPNSPTSCRRRPASAT